MIRAIIFDCFGVLTTDTWKEFTAALPKEQLEPARELNRVYDAGHITKTEFVKAIQSLTGKQVKYVEDLLDNEVFKNEELLRYIAELKRHYKIGLLSNIATNWVREKFLSATEQQLFDAYAFSFEVGAAKPDAKMYAAITERLETTPEECIFVDDVEGYCTAAEDLGMRAVCYKNFTQMKAELERLLHNTER